MNFILHQVEKTGREKVISDAYFEQALEMDNPNLSLASFIDKSFLHH